MEQKQGKILIVDDNEDLLKAAKTFAELSVLVAVRMFSEIPSPM